MGKQPLTNLNKWVNRSFTIKTNEKTGNLIFVFNASLSNYYEYDLDTVINGFLISNANYHGKQTTRY